MKTSFYESRISTIPILFSTGAAGHGCAETLRQEGYTGKILIVTKDMHIPYDRTKLSKAMNMDATKLALRSVEYYAVILNATNYCILVWYALTTRYPIESRYRLRF